MFQPAARYGRTMTGRAREAIPPSWPARQLDVTAKRHVHCRLSLEGARLGGDEQTGLMP